MVDPIAAWHAEHVRFGQLLDLLQEEVAAFHAERQPDYELMRDIVYYLRHVADGAHHAREDMAYACLLKRDPGLEAAVSRLVQEHRAIAVAGETLLGYLDDIAAEVMVERKVVEAAADTYLACYRQHLAAEESEMLPRAAAQMTPGDWAAVATALTAQPDPLFGEDFAAPYRRLRERLVVERREPA